jgi:hypothetical protein
VAGATVQEGFSGCPVWSKHDELLGVIVRAAKGRRIAVYAPATILPRNLAYDKPVRGTDNWKLRFFRSQGLSALLNDLDVMEADGLEGHECELIRQTLGNVCTHMSALEETADWEVPLHREIETLRNSYVEWNDCARGPGGRHDRRVALDRLRAQRHKVNKKIAVAEGLLFQENLDDMIDEILSDLRTVAATYPAKFPKTRTAASRYFQRSATP